MKTTAQLFKALSEEIRLRILNLLTTGELCVCDLMAILELPQSTVSRHLAYLRNCGLVSDRRKGVWMYYRQNEQLEDFQQRLLALLQAELADLPAGREDRARLAQRKASAAENCPVTK